MDGYPATGSWSIYSVQKTLPVLGQVGGILGAHNYLVIVNPNGNPVEEMQGVPTNSFVMNGTKAGDYLQVQNWTPNQYMQDQTITSQKLVMSGSETQIRTDYNNAYNIVSNALNNAHMLYDGVEISGHAINSNSVWNTALLALGVQNPSLYDGPDSTPGNGIDLRNQPSNNTYLNTTQDPWQPNPSSSSYFYYDPPSINPTDGTSVSNPIKHADASDSIDPSLSPTFIEYSENQSVTWYSQTSYYNDGILDDTIIANKNGTYQISFNSTGSESVLSVTGLNNVVNISPTELLLTDANANQYHLFMGENGVGNELLQSLSGNISIVTDARISSNIQLGSTLLLSNALGDTLTLFQAGTGTINLNGTQEQISAPSVLQLDPDAIRIAPSNNDNGLGTDYGISPTGTLDGSKQGFLGLPDGLNFAAYQSDASAAQVALPSIVPLYTPTGPLNNSVLTSINVGPLTGGLYGNANGDATDNGYVPEGSLGGYVITGAGVSVTTSNANVNGVAANSDNNIVTDNWQPGNATVMSPTQNGTDQVNGADLALAAGAAVSGYNTYLSDIANTAYNFANTDPLVIGLSGGAIGLTNWIDNTTYFDTNLNAAGTGADGALHHTSWVNSGTGILALDRNRNGKIDNITETLSEYFGGGPTPYAYADGLAALATLSTSSTVFSRATSKTDSATGSLYWDEIVIAQGLPDATGAIPASQLETLAAAGISSISLTGSGNQGESLAGSAVTNRTTATTTSGSLDQVAAVDFQTDTTGDITYSQNGGVVINSSAEGTPRTTNSFVDQTATARTLTLNNGTLTSGGTTVASGLTAVFATNQADTITVNASDTTAYWLSAGTAAATLTGGAGNTVFIINSKEFATPAAPLVHGGTGFNIAQVNDSAPISIDLGAANLQEVVGGAGDGTFNASDTTDNVFIQGGAGNNIIIGGAAHDALAGGTGSDLIEAGPGGSVIHAGSGNDVIYGGSIKTGTTPNSDVIYGGPGTDTVVLGTNNSAVYVGTGNMTIIGNNQLNVGSSSTKAFSVVFFTGSYANYKLVHNADGTTTITDNQAGQNGTVTLQNVTNIGFSDVGQFSLTTTPGLPVNDTVAISGTGPYVIHSSILLANDIDYQSKALSIYALESSSGTQIARGSSGIVTGGTVALSADGSNITFTPTQGFTGVPTFRYYVQDTSGAYTQIQLYNSAGAAVGSPVQMSAAVSLLNSTMPTDPGFTSEWYLQAADVLPAWAAGYTGAGVSVGVFDPSGNVDFTNPDLAANEGQEFQYVSNPQGTGGTVQPGVGKIGTHATLVAGAIAAARDGQGNVGVAYNAILSSEADPDPTGPTTAFAVLNDWSKYAVVNNSWTTTQPYGDIQGGGGSTAAGIAYELQNAATQGRNGLGTAVVVSAGNQRTVGFNTEESSITSNQEEITVGGVDQPQDLGSLQIAPTPFSTPGASVLVSAPDSGISTTGSVQINEYGEQFGSASATDDGTSFSAPIVSGVIALMLQANPKLGARDIQEILALTATEAATNTSADANAAYSFNGATDWNGGGMHESYDYGFGEVDAAAAVRLAKTWKIQDTFTNETFTQDQQSFGSYTSETGLYNGTYTVNAAPGKGLAANNHGYSTDATGLLIPDAVSGSSPYIDFAAGSLPSAATITAQHVYLTLTIAFPTLTTAATQLATADALLAAMTVTLKSADGTVSTVMSPASAAQISAGSQQPDGAAVANGQNYPTFQYNFDTVRDWNENANQDYQVAVTYAAGTANQGEIQSAQLQVFGDKAASGTGQIHYYTDEFGTLASGSGNARATLTDAGSNVVLNASSVSTGTFLDLRPGSTDSMIAGQALAIAANTTITTAYGGNGNSTFIGGSSNDTFDGEGTNNAVSYANSTGGMIVSLVTKKDSRGDTLNDIQNIIGSKSLDVITGDGQTDILDGNGGSDTLTDSGNTTYIFSRGYGVLKINNGGSTGPADGTLSITAGVSAEQLWLSQSGSNLVIQILGTSDSVTLANWFTSSSYDLAQVDLADGSILAGPQIAALVAVMHSYAAAHSNFIIGSATVVPADPTLQAAMQTAWAETLTGGSGPSVLRAIIGNDTLVAGTGNQVLIGGTGHNTYSFSAGDGVDSVTNFQAGMGGDQVVLSNVANSTITLGTTLFSQLAGISSLGAVTLETADGNTVSIGTLPTGMSLYGTGDFNGDGTQDYLLRNLSTGAIDVWYSSVTGYTDAHLSMSVPTNNHALYGDFDGDGRTDILWVNNAGQGDIWWANNSGSGFTDGGAVCPNFSIAGVGDLNGDGVADIIETNGSATFSWLMGKGTRTYSFYPELSASASNIAIASADFSGDGTSDILWWMSSLGEYGVSLSDNGLGAAPTAIPVPYGTPATLLATGDFNDDGKTDIAFGFQGNVYIWYMNGAAQGAGSFGEASPSGLTFVGAGDMNGDGKTDLVWQNLATHQVTIWWGAVESNSTTLAANSQITSVAAVANFFGKSIAINYAAGAQANLDDVSQSNFDVVNNVSGASTLSYAASATGVTASLSNDATSSDGLTRISSLIGSPYNDTLTGNSSSGILNGGGGNDTLIAGSGTETLVACSGYDVMNAGAGQDTFDFAAGNGGSFVTGFITGSGHDVIALSNPTNGVVNINASQYSQLAGVSTSGAVTLETADGNTVSVGTLATGMRMYGTGDFNGDGRQDYLLRNMSTGAIDVWYSSATGGYTDGNLSMTIPAADYAMYGDFDGDGKTDIIWVNGNTGYGDVWWANAWGVGFTDGGAVCPNFTMPAVGDLNGDGVTDLIEVSGSTVYAWIMGKGTRTYSSYPLLSSGTSNRIVGTGDFSGDGKADILWWMPAYGEYGISLSDNGLGAAPVAVPTPFGTQPLVEATGDFNGDGKTDLALAFQGSLYIWYMNGTIQGAGSFGEAMPNLTFVGAGDVNGDGKSDLVWQNATTHQITIWWGGVSSNSTALAANSQITSVASVGNFFSSGTTLTDAPGSTISLDGTQMSSFDLVNNLTGASTASYASSAIGISATLNANATPTDGLTHISNVIGSSYNDVLTGNSGSNTFTGDGGVDKYVFGTGEQSQTVINGLSTNNVAKGELDMAFNHNQLWLARSGNDLDVDILGTTKQAVIKNWYAGSSAAYAQLSKIVSTGDSLTLDAGVANLVQAMATFQANNGAFNSQTAGTTMPTDTNLQNAIATAWHH